MKKIILLLCFCLSLAAIEKKTFSFTTDPIDVVIPCAPKDAETLKSCIQGIRKHGKNIRRVIVVSQTKLTDEAEWFDEKKYPFDKKTLALEIFKGNQKKADKFLGKKGCRIGWIYQQFLKLYAPFVIPGISSNVLILDSDVVFLKPTEFMDEKGAPYFTLATEYHLPYFDHAKRLLPYLERVNEKHSGVAHHMLFQKPILEDLFASIEKEHRELPWKALCHTINPKIDSCLSEYEIYFNYTLLRTDQAHIRPLKSTNITTLDRIEKFERKGYDFITSHNYL